ncbi:MAG: ATP-dependent Clp protease ATP-binding subunit [Paludibacteraceae bacterium]|nr:ATP-dependent Clp protease ATP-binding subunit [Paludibacteraceae bacterium]
MQTIRFNKILLYARNEAERLFNTEILPEHLLLAIIRLEEGTAYDLLLRAGLRPEEAKRQLDDDLAQPEPELVQAISYSYRVERILRIAESEAREYQTDTIGSAHLLMALLRERVNHAAAYLEQQWNITYDSMLRLFPKQQTQNTPRNGSNLDSDTPDAQPKKERKKPLEKSKSDTPALDKYGHDLTRMAEEKRLDPVVGRDVEITRVIQILARRKKNNPILIGDPGVGKSAIVEGLALRIQSGEAPELQGKRIFTLDIAAMVAGTTYRGQFEERMRSLIQELTDHPEIILFIDEIHTIIGAGNAQGSLDAANILKPALARGEVRCIGATTTGEYAKSIEKDGALERRFQKVPVVPTDRTQTLAILERLAAHYADFHHVQYPDETLQACVDLAERYLTDRAFPDKAIDVMDEAGARCRGRLITPDDIASVVSMMSGVPVQRVQRAESERLRTMADALLRQVIGQDEAVRTVVRAIQRSRLGLRDPRRPIGTFFFLGPTGVGKTHLAQCLAEEMFGSRDALIRFDMSEYAEKHTASLLVGAPPGYVAHEEGGKLTEAVRRKPYSIVLFDEIEKAHPDIFNVLLQVLDEGRLTDRQGHSVDFRNTIIILTSNVGTRQLKEFGAGIGFAATEPDSKTTHAMLTKALNKTFPPEFINRIDNVITFGPLSPESLQRILDIEIDRLKKRLREQGYTLTVDAPLRRRMVDSVDKQYGARPLRRAVQNTLEDRITDLMLNHPERKRLVLHEKQKQP